MTARYLWPFLLAAAVLPCAAGAGNWIPAGPADGGIMRAIEADNAIPGRFYAASLHGFFRSDDGGETWNAPGAGLTEVMSNNAKLQSHPILGGIVYAGGTSLVWKSTDGGENWHLHSNGLPGEDVSLPADERRLNALATVRSRPHWLFAATASGLYRSTDAGLSWSATGFDDYAYRLGVNPADPDVMILVGFDFLENEYRVYRSADGGTSWAPLEPLLPPGHDVGDWIVDIRFTDFSGTVLMLGENGRYRSGDAGLTWSLQSGDNYGPTDVIAVNPHNASNLLIAGSLVESVDGGLTWGDPEAVPRGPHGRPILYARPEGFSNVYLNHDVVFDPFDPNHRLVATESGIYRWPAGGFAWQKSHDGVDALDILSLAVNPDEPEEIFAGVATLHRGNRAVLYHSVNGGGSWTALTSGLLATTIGALVIDPATSGSSPGLTLYAGGANDVPETDGSGNPVPTDGGIYKSTNGGQTWSVIDDGLPVEPGHQNQQSVSLVRDIVLRPDSAGGSDGSLQTVFLVWRGQFVSDASGDIVQESARVYKSTNAGDTWQASDTGLPQPAQLVDAYPGGQRLVIDPNDNDIMYLSTILTSNLPSNFNGTPIVANGIFKSTDGGANWSHASDGLPRIDVADPGSSHMDVFALALDPGEPDTLYASAVDSTRVDTPNDPGVFKSVDGADSWTRLTGLPTDLEVHDIKLDTDGNIYAADYGDDKVPGSIWRSTDGGQTWNSISTGFGERNIAARLLVDDTADPLRIYAGTRRSVQKFELAEDLDNDGVPDVVENAGPGNGDANNDGVPDSGQAAVATLVGLESGRGDTGGGNYATLEVTPVEGSCSGLNDAVSPAGDDMPGDAGRSYPHGVMRFELVDCERAEVRLVYHAGQDLDTQPWMFRVYGPETPGATGFVWQPFSGAMNTAGSEVNFTLMDGAPGDIDPDDDRIVFQGGMATLAEEFFRDGFELN